jgi:hypothetical protein
MKVIFLDIDGVLNTGAYSVHFFELMKLIDKTRKEAKAFRQEILRDEFGNKFDPLTIDALKNIIEATGAKIVVSSTWRKSGLYFIEKMWEFRDLPGEIIDITPILNTPRGEEIDYWLKENEVDSYLILDDDRDMLPEQESNFIRTNGTYGLTLTDAEKAIEILNKVGN